MDEDNLRTGSILLIISNSDIISRYQWQRVLDVSNQPFSQLVNHEVFLLTWAESTMYVTGAIRLHGPNDYRILTGKWGLWTLLVIMFFIFDLTFLRLACCNWEMLYDKLLVFSNPENVQMR